MNRPVRMLGTLLLSFAVAGVVLIIGLVAERASRFDTGDGGARWELEADLSLSGFEMDQVSTDGIGFHMQADGAKLVELNRTLLAEGLQLVFFEAGAKALTLSAEVGEVQLDSNEVSLRGEAAPVTLTLAEGVTIQSPAMHWDPKNRTVRTQGGATVTDDRFTAQGQEAIADIDAQTVQLIGGVEVAWQP